jgi:type IV pilus assembly protein PilM
MMLLLPQALKTKLQRFFEPRLPSVACELNRRAIALVRLDSKNAAIVDRFVVTPLPPGLLVPSLVEPNIRSVPDFVTALKTAFTKADLKTPRISLAIPDASAKVAIHHLDMLPGNENEKLMLLRWKLKKTVPFNVEDAHLSYLDYKGLDGHYKVLTVCIHKAVLAQYEEVFQKLGMHPGYISLSSFAAFELLVRLEPELWQQSVLFLRVRSSGSSSLVTQQGSVVFFRQVDYEAEESEAAASLSARTEAMPDLYSELHPSVMYYQDRLSAKPLDKIYVACPTEPTEAVLSSLSEKFQSPVLKLDPMCFFQSLHPGSLGTLKNALMPALGLALGRF